MPFSVPLEEARTDYPGYTFISALTPSEQKAAFHVRDKMTGRDLCLKIIAPNYRIDRLNREIQALKSIVHPNVVAFVEYTFSIKLEGERHFIVEEFIEGTDLSDALKPGQQWSTMRAFAFFAELCDGLSILSNNNIVHRDLKPSNIRIRPSGSPVIIDFGLARLLDLPDITSTSEGAAIGTLQYFSPEQCKGTKYDIDHRTDLFALGVMLYQALVGYHPFWQGGMSDSQIRDAICNSDAHLATPEFLALPEKWRLIAERLLCKERSGRPSNAGQVAIILSKIGAV